MDRFLDRIKSFDLWKRAILWALLLGLVFTIGRAISNDMSITVGHIVRSLFFWLIIGAPIYAITMAAFGRRD